MDFSDTNGGFSHYHAPATGFVQPARPSVRNVSVPGKIIRITGESRSVEITRLADDGVRIEGATGIATGEAVLLLLEPGDPVIELAVRWVVGNQAGAVIRR